MDKYEVIGLVGEGSYGQVIKCRHKDSGQLVAIKKFIETEEDQSARKMALREIRMLKRLRHDNLVNMLEVFRRKKRFHLVFEFMKETLLDKFEQLHGLSESKTREYTYQIIRGLDFCHNNNIVHRDLKPENVLVSTNDVIKLCDFGFARFITISQDPFTEYVATRWYRAPELLVGDVKYGRAVDIWALGCMMLEMLTSEPLFPGDSDIDQLYKITSVIGNLTPRQMQCLRTRLDTGFMTSRIDEGAEVVNQLQHVEDEDEVPKGYLALKKMYPKVENRTLHIISSCLRMDPSERLKSHQLFTHVYFTWDQFPRRFLPELYRKIELDNLKRPVVSQVPCSPPTDHTELLAASVSCPKLTDWKIDLVPVPKQQSNESMKPPTISKSSYSTLPLQFQQSPNLTSSDAGQVDQVTERVEPSPSIPPLESEITSVKEELMPGLLRNCKLMARYRRDILPQTKHILQINGRLADNDSIVNTICPAIPQKPKPKDFCLPDLPGVDPKKRKKESILFTAPPSDVDSMCLHFARRKLSYCSICDSPDNKCETGSSSYPKLD
ncbi:cyclin-dependent kinase-like 1 isoform X1 [Cimex lectularius]|uniref:cyclin-dependent kinase n=1 Tax=Cimex lectularius TaxID=79782 RepID=A0A8I6RDK9_CIMLE|nr:cyclin-dependent kinase-like 1 isoform X1 [Cimex lectularius]XP_014241870.1 cyclin-dependent kinase-like 1 isoform X1 [Cimex lectularius]XP_014241871.1 cyclin-dependent kinase-like 1 isoform X1 [Cimex lectularius]XP_014241872.1 cyclin-dependent kinase-like 1 isoform X1 [Cimex lectularius]XP_014241873.1 cyclin-dependent kinase-like 1 isoform X1 [Cimex lectularius]